jgi:hypothetical protein
MLVNMDAVLFKPLVFAVLAGALFRIVIVLHQPKSCLIMAICLSNKACWQVPTEPGM